MASNKNLIQHNEPSNGSELLRIVRTLESEAHGEGVPEGVRRSVDALVELLDEMGVLGEGDSTTTQVGLEQAWQREEAGLAARAKIPERHDAKRVPSGFSFWAGHLARKGHMIGLAMPLGRPWPASAYIAKSIIHTLACWLDVTVRGETEQLVDAIMPLLNRAVPNGFVMQKEPQLRAMWEALAGKPWGYPRWAETLENQLYMNARHEEERRLREAHGYPPRPEPEYATPAVAGAFWGTATAEEIHAVVARGAEKDGETLPAELTVAAVSGMMDQTKIGVGKGGRGGRRTADRVVADFVARVGRGNSGR